MCFEYSGNVKLKMLSKPTLRALLLYILSYITMYFPIKMIKVNWWITIAQFALVKHAAF